MNKKLLLSQKEQQTMLPAFDEHVLFALERRYLDFMNIERLELAPNPMLGSYDYKTHLRMLRVDEVSYHGQLNQGLHLNNFQNILAALKNDSHSVVSLIKSDGQKNSFYYGLSRRLDVPTQISTNEYARMLGQTIQGNFLGAKLSPLNSDQTFSEVVHPVLEQQSILAFPGIPSLRLKDPNGPYVQGIDRFIEGMRGEKYSLMVIAEPVSLPNIDDMMKNLFDLGTSVHSSVHANIQKMRGSADTLNMGMFGMKGVSDASTTGESTTDSETESTSQTDGSSATRMGPGGLIASSGGAIGAVIGSFIAPGLGTIAGGMIGSAIGAGGSMLFGAPLATGTSHAVTDALSRTHSFTRSVANTAANTLGGGLFGGYGRSWNRSIAVTQDMLNKNAEHCEKLIDAYIERLQNGKNLGLWNVGVYLLTSNKYTSLRGEGILRSALCGDKTYWEPVRSLNVNNETIGQYLSTFNNPKYNLFLYGEEKRQVEIAVTSGSKVKEFAEKTGKKVLDVFSVFNRADTSTQTKILEKIRQQPGRYTKEALEKAWDEIRDAYIGHPLGQVLGGVSTPMNTEELSIIMNVPREEVRGLTIRDSAPFGVNYSPEEPLGDDITIGNIIHKREVLSDSPFNLSKNLFKKHGFICGVTGSGKTNTCMNLLNQLGTPFMVIEPAKSEYRQLVNIIPELKIFTLGNENISPFRINPFEFVPGSQLLTHIDCLKTVFNASFPMYASMPYLLEEAIIDVYLDKGWELATSTNRYFDILDTELFYNYLPTLEDLLEKIDTVVKSKKYAQELSMDLSAALRARLSSLLTGSKGLMLNTRRSTPLDELLKGKVLLELKYIGDDDEKCFLMGLILTLIYEYRETHHDLSRDLNHVTLIEEAHRLLKRVPEYASIESANARGKAVETFTNIISEIREYGEGILISDQIPTKLASDVIKNTNMKIVHRTLSKDDRDMVGATMTLTESQNRELPLLKVGQAVVHSEGLDKPFLLQIPLVKDLLEKMISDDQVKQLMLKFHNKHLHIFNRLPGFEKDLGIRMRFNCTDFRTFNHKIYSCIIASAAIFASVEQQAIPEVLKISATIIKRETRSDNPISMLCQIIWYSNRFFSKLNEEYSGQFDNCQKAHQIFIDLWFESLKNSPKEKSLKRFYETMADIVSNGEPLEPMIVWYVNKSNAAQKLSKILDSTNWEENYEKVDQYLSKNISEIVLGASISLESTKRMKVYMLKIILKGNPFSDAILKIYINRY